MRFNRRALPALTVLVLGAAALAVMSGPPFGSSAHLPKVLPPVPPDATMRATRAGSAASPSAARFPAASPGTQLPAASSEIIAVASRADQKLALIDSATGKLTGTVDLGIPVQSMALMPNRQMAWMFSSKPGDPDFITVDLVKRERKDTVRLRDNPSAAAFSTDGRRAYVALGGGNDSPPRPSSVVFLDTGSSAEFGRIDVGVQNPGEQMQRRLVAVGVAPGSGGDVLYAAGNASGAVWALDGGSGGLLAEIEVGGGPLAVLTDPAQKRVYVVADTTNELVAIDTSNQQIVSRLKLPGRPTAAASGPGRTLYIAGGDAGQVWPIDAANWRVGTPIHVGNQPAGLTVSLDRRRLYVAVSGSGSLAVVDLSRNQVSSTIPVGKDPVAVLVAPGRPPAGATPTPTPVPIADPTATPTLVATATPLPDGAAPPEHLPSGAVSEQFMSAEVPVAIAFAPDGRLFYNELHTGKIRVVQNGALLPEPFYQFRVSGEPEAGLTGLTLDPDFAANHHVYVFYTSVPEGQDTGGTNGPNQLMRLTEVANHGTDLTAILSDLPSGPIHNSGILHFGPDRKLYVSIGDNDRSANAQDLSTLAGKISRVNPDGTIPGDNPFVGQNGKQPAIWAYGLRNLFGFDFDPQSHNLLATANGPGDNDELDLVLKGGNYGWPPTGYKYTPGIIDPLAVFNPPIAPTGMTFYTGSQIADWKNDWFYCNYHQGQLRRVRLAPGSRDRVVFDEIVKNGCSLAVANAPDGALYYTDAKGIYRIHSSNAVKLIAAVSTAAVTPTPEPSLPAGTRAEDRDVNVSLSEWKLQPSRTRLPAGKIRFLAENTGDTQHALRIVGQNIDVSTDDFGPGQSRTIQIVLAPGEYQLVCPVPGHEQQGMTASLTVAGP